MSRKGRETQPTARRRFTTDQFRQHAFPLVLDEGKSISAVARELDLSPRRWVSA